MFEYWSYLTHQGCATRGIVLQGIPIMSPYDDVILSFFFTIITYFTLPLKI